MKKILYILTGLFIASSFVACEPEFSNPIGSDTYTSGDADFTTYVAVGNSLTAGYTNGTVYKSAQQNSYPAILAEQMKAAGGGEFTQPYYDDDTKDIGGMVMGGSTVILEPKLIINASAGGPERINQTPTIELTNIHPGPYNNMGVPGAKVYHLVAPGYGNIANIPLGKANPYYVRMAAAPDNSVIQDAVAQNPTFFTLWIGANDVLGYATSGGTGVDHNEDNNLDPSTYAGNDITNVNVFGSVYSQIVDALTVNGAEGVVATIPDIASIPFFTTIPYNAIPVTSQAQADALNAAYANYNGGLQQALQGGLIDSNEAAARTINFTVGANPIVIEDEYLTDLSALGMPSIRPATADDLFVLTAKSVIGVAPDPNNPQYVYGVTIPLSDQWVLVKDEISKVRAATAGFNQMITNIAAVKGLPVADMAVVMEDLKSGLAVEDGSVYTADYFNGSNLDKVTFSLDGVHPTPRGYAIIANRFIDVIEQNFAAKLPKVVPAYYPTFDILPTN
jgi:lysophospholipase L1-like esterase